MSLRKFVPRLVAGVIGAAVLVGGTGVAGADPDDATPVIIDELQIVVPPLAQDPRLLNPAEKHGANEWGGTGMYCQNAHVKCQKQGF